MAYSVETLLYQFLKTKSAVTDLVGGSTAPRIRPDRLHQADTLPAVIIEVDTSDHCNTLDGLGGLVFSEVNVICRASTRAGSRALAEAVRVNGTDPGTGLAGASGSYGGTSFDAVLEDEVTSYTPAGDGSDQGWYDTNMSFVVSVAETT